MNILDGLPEEKLSEAAEAALGKDDESINTLVLHSLREGFLYAKACYPKLEDGELLSACYDGLRRAAKRFQPARGRFFGYAKADLRSALNKLTRSRDVVKRGPRELEALPEPDAVDATCFEEESTFVPKFRAKKIDCTPPDFTGIHARELWAQIEPELSGLSAEENMVVRLHFQGGLNLREIGDLLNCSRAWIQKIKSNAFEKIKLRLRPE